MSNGFEAAERWVKEIERHHETLATYTGEHMARCRSVRESISGCFDAAKESGIPVKELRAVIKERSLLKRIDALRDGLEEDQAETYDQIKHALGMIADLPLGDAALKRSDAIDSLTSDQAPADDANAAAAKANAGRLRGGIAKLQ